MQVRCLHGPGVVHSRLLCITRRGGGMPKPGTDIAVEWGWTASTKHASLCALFCAPRCFAGTRMVHWWVVGWVQLPPHSWLPFDAALCAGCGSVGPKRASRCLPVQVVGLWHAACCAGGFVCDVGALLSLAACAPVTWKEHMASGCGSWCSSWCSDVFVCSCSRLPRRPPPLVWLPVMEAVVGDAPGCGA
jgi:hypothetical protein